MLTARTVLLLLGLLSPRCRTAPYTPAECCFDHIKGILRVDILVDSYSTHSECFLPAIVFETKKRVKVCANPEEKWVKRAIRLLQKKKGLGAP